MHDILKNNSIIIRPVFYSAFYFCLVNIPVSFDYKGKAYSGTLSSPSGGGGGDTWHLSINNFYKGCLQFLQRSGWCFTTQNGRYDEWALILGKAVKDAYSGRDFKPELPPPVKMFEFTYNTLALKANVEVHNLHEGHYYLHIKDRFVHGRPVDGFDQAYFSRRQHGNEKPFWHFTCYQYKELFEVAGQKVEEYGKKNSKIELY